ncbi:MULTISPECIES: DUF3592 domain-containing protein [Ferrimonas]|uniref:DUF3592 domain-containing protein n=1 Tax=Ferrimonas TaxID=44011 RepID=UPI000400ED38|nr:MULTISPECIES: DUF3592 domain-containing protein [Ferrimonas]USD35893.1 DUF3592 domain-containing protein [Ferrimonas sp. SCSIO 43195]
MRRFRLSQVSYFIWFMFTLFSFAVGLAAYVVHEFHASFNWPTTRGMVVDTWIEEIHTQGSSADPHYEVGIEFVYAIGEEFHHKRNKTDINGAIPGYSREEAQSLVAEYPRGKVIEVHYKPGAHDTAVITPTMHPFMIVGLVIFSLVLAPILYVMYRQMTGDPDSYLVRYV